MTKNAPDLSFDRAKAIANLPADLQPKNIVDVLVQSGSTTELIEITENSFCKLFESEEFECYEIEHRKKVLAKYRFLMTMLRKADKFQYLTTRDTFKDT